MPFIDVLNKLEQLEIIPGCDEWIDFRNLRNNLTHDYPDNDEEKIEVIHSAVKVYKEMVTIYNNTKRIADERGSR